MKPQINEKSIYVTQPYLPPLHEFMPYLEEIWENKILTNNGPFHQRLEAKLCEYLGVSYVSLFANGTLGLITALQALRITGEVITTPYSFVATSHSLLWHGIKPVFVDIDPLTLNLDPKKIEAAITPQTTAILPVHCYGNPCNLDAIQKIADTYNLRVIYDAAHAFGVRDNGKSILNNGDISVLSFHATKVFNTFEGGAIICPDIKTKQRIDHLKNFGFVDEITVAAPGINGKMSEFNAALGLLQLEHIDNAIKQRKIIYNFYKAELSSIKGIEIIPQVAETPNFSYFPILIKPDYSIGRDELHNLLREKGIYTRRYFYPLITDFPMYRGLPSASKDNLKIASKAASQVLCLPIFPGLPPLQLQKIIEIIANPYRHKEGKACKSSNSPLLALA